MGTYYAYCAPERKEYLDFMGPAFEGVRCNLKYPTERAQAEVLHRLLLGPWNGCVIRCDGDTTERPWEDPYDDDPIEGWQSVEDVHAELVKEAVETGQRLDRQRKGLT